MKLRLPKVPPGERLRLKYSDVTPYACKSDVAAPTAPARPSAQSTGREAVAPKDAADPEERGSRERDRERAGREPSIIGEQSGDSAQREIDDEHPIDAREREPSSWNQAAERRTGGGDVQHQLLRHEVAIEIERLVWKRHQHHRQRRELHDHERDAVGFGR